MIRKLLTIVEETHQECEQAVQPATRKAAAIAVIWNPYTGRRADDRAKTPGREVPGLERWISVLRGVASRQ